MKLRARLADERGAYQAPPLRVDHLPGLPPAAGASFAMELDSRYWWKFRSVRFQLDTGANAGARTVSVDYCDQAGDVWMRSLSAQSVDTGVANAEWNYAIGVDGGVQPSVTVTADRLGEMWLPPGWQVQINVAGIKAGDQLHSIRMYVEQHPTSPDVQRS